VQAEKPVPVHGRTAPEEYPDRRSFGPGLARVTSRRRVSMTFVHWLKTAQLELGASSAALSNHHLPLWA
jgi:hypothetical protein